MNGFLLGPARPSAAAAAPDGPRPAEQLRLLQLDTVNPRAQSLNPVATRAVNWFFFGVASNFVAGLEQPATQEISEHHCCCHQSSGLASWCEDCERSIADWSVISVQSESPVCPADLCILRTCKYIIQNQATCERKWIAVSERLLKMASNSSTVRCSSSWGTAAVIKLPIFIICWWVNFRYLYNY